MTKGPSSLGLLEFGGVLPLDEYHLAWRGEGATMYAWLLEVLFCTSNNLKIMPHSEAILKYFKENSMRSHSNPGFTSDFDGEIVVSRK